MMSIQPYASERCVYLSNSRIYGSTRLHGISPFQTLIMPVNFLPHDKIYQRQSAAGEQAFVTRSSVRARLSLVTTDGNYLSQRPLLSIVIPTFARAWNVQTHTKILAANMLSNKASLSRSGVRPGLTISCPHDT